MLQQHMERHLSTTPASVLSSGCLEEVLLNLLQSSCSLKELKNQKAQRLQMFSATTELLGEVRNLSQK